MGIGAEMPTGTLDQLKSQHKHLGEEIDKRKKSLEEEFGAELTEGTVLAARSAVFVDFVIESGILTEEQVLQFEILHQKQVKEALGSALKMAADHAEQIKKAEAAARLGLGGGMMPPGAGPGGKPRLVGPGGIPL